MGMFNRNNNNKSHKCNCPHCRGGHVDYGSNIDYDSNSEYDVNHDEIGIELDRLDPEELVNQYIEDILECDDEEEVAELIYDLFDEVFAYAMQEAYIADIEAKIQALHMIKNEFDEED